VRRDQSGFRVAARLIGEPVEKGGKAVHSASSSP
jgi:hypothetical protein